MIWISASVDIKQSSQIWARGCIIDDSVKLETVVACAWYYTPLPFVHTRAHMHQAHEHQFKCQMPFSFYS